jgi:hypothetical protein
MTFAALSNDVQKHAEEVSGAVRIYASGISPTELFESGLLVTPTDVEEALSIGVVKPLMEAQQSSELDDLIMKQLTTAQKAIQTSEFKLYTQKLLKPNSEQLV